MFRNLLNGKLCNPTAAEYAKTAQSVLAKGMDVAAHCTATLTTTSLGQILHLVCTATQFIH
jgi:hypothetical protein